MKTMTISVATDHVNVDRELTSEHKSDAEALRYLTGFININAAFGGFKIMKVEVK